MRRLVAALAASAVGATLFASPASADWQWWDPPLTVVNSTNLSTGFADLALSSATGQIFVSNGRDHSTITVFDLDGQVLDTIDGQTGAVGLELSADGSTLYAALAEGDAISAIDVATHTERARWTLATDACPYDVALAAGRLWFSQGCPGQHGTLNSVDPADPTAAPVLDQGGHFTFAPRLEGAGTLLFAVEEGVFPNKLISFDLAGGQPVRRTALEQLQSVSQFAVDPDGQSIIVVTPGEYQFTSKVARYSAADLTEIIRYAAPGPVISVAFGADGRVATHAEDGGLAMFAPDREAALWSTFREFSPGLEPARRGLAVGAEGRFYAVEKLLSDGAMTLTTVDVGPVDTTIEIDNLAFPALVRKPYAISGKLVAADGTSTGALTVHVTRRDPRGTTTLPDVTTRADGTFTVTDTPRVVGETTWTMTFDGTGRLLPYTYTVTVPVTRR
ncbi:hypothetical protein O7635_15330 [Asanoa sp. WMMD1127]|uniref:hypothetical protein n=1 Tax=Asanoa sp. WMMD1127 TaxID=3016107 RepID=UPI0024176E27|nr:hypothetical protein [Asanoa sp. WMMD1127]MDG4823227.1 hypothetical protein [Asanoa sp. WMMD1127]